MPISFIWPKLPLCGTLQLDFDLFQYQVLGLCPEGVMIGMPHHASHLYVLNEFDSIHLHMAFKWNEIFFTRGNIDSIEMDASGKKMLRVAFIPEPYYAYPLYIDLDKEGIGYLAEDANLCQSVAQCLKEFILLKKGVKIYVNHLNIYFSRVIGYHHEKYTRFSQFFFDNTLAILNSNLEKIEKIASNYQQFCSFKPIEELINFNELLALIESELNVDILNQAFYERDHLTYTVAIKELEQQLYWNYNKLSILYEVIRMQSSTSRVG